MPIKLGCASYYNKNHPDRVRKTRERETVVLVATRKYAWVDCDEHVVELAPRIPTYEEWKNSDKTPRSWKKFLRKYTFEMRSNKSLAKLQNLWERSNNGEIIRLLCYEKDDNPYCHRYLLKLLIDEYRNNTLK